MWHLCPVGYNPTMCGYKGVIRVRQIINTRGFVGTSPVSKVTRARYLRDNTYELTSKGMELSGAVDTRTRRMVTILSLAGCHFGWSPRSLHNSQSV